MNLQEDLGHNKNQKSSVANESSDSEDSESESDVTTKAATSKKKHAKAPGLDFYQFQLVNSLLTHKLRSEYPGSMETKANKESIAADIKSLHDSTQ